jgi:hypothetical protein
MAVALGQRLARAARRKEKSVIWLAGRIGCTRVTVYHWFAGGGVSPAYRPKVERLVAQLEK